MEFVISRFFVNLKVDVRLSHFYNFKLVHIGIVDSDRKVFKRHIFAVDDCDIGHLAVHNEYAAVAVYRQVLLVFYPDTYIITMRHGTSAPLLISHRIGNKKVFDAYFVGIKMILSLFKCKRLFSLYVFQFAKRLLKTMTYVFADDHFVFFCIVIHSCSFIAILLLYF